MTTTAELYDVLWPDLLRRYEESEARSIARIVLEDVFEYRTGTKERVLSADEMLLFRHILQRLLRGEPVQYILGEADFYGLKFRVDPRVLIPRQETEELVHWILETWKAVGRPAGLQLIDIGTGTGCIPIALKREAPTLDASGLDLQPDILELARENAQRNAVAINWIQQDILQADHWERLGPYDLIVSNPPYIPPSQRSLMPEHVLAHEPELALFVPEDDPLIFYREIGLFAHRRLRPGGYLFFETNEYNAPRVAELLRDIGFQAVELRRDLAGKERMIRAGLK